MNKIKIIWVVFLIFTLNESCKNSTENKTITISKQDSRTYTVQANRLKDDYKQVCDTVNNEFYKQKFLSDFPSTFDSFYHLYGYSDTLGEMPLYKDYEKHIELFCEEVNKREIGAEKIIRLGIDGRWEADAVGTLQKCIRVFVNNKIDLIIPKFKELTQSQMHSFWKFYFDGPHPDDKEIKDQYSLILAKVKVLDSAMAKIIVNEYENILKSAEIHGK
jgi:hypothetical protein